MKQVCICVICEICGKMFSEEYMILADFCILRMLRLLLARLDLVGWIVADLPAVELSAVGQDQLLLLVMVWDGRLTRLSLAKLRVG